jgi:hypothetical protein
MRLSSILSVAALSLAAVIASPAAAAPLGAGTAKVATPAGSVAEKVHWRPYRHCHRGRYGRRYCHGGRSYRRHRGPGIGIYIGPKPRHYRRHHRRY